jgi:hypothetical protein
MILPCYVDLDEYLCIKTERTIRNDNTIALDGRLYQLEQRGGKKVVVQERIDGSLILISKGVALKYKAITERPKKEVAPKTDLRMYNRPQKPSKDHPWKRKWQIQKSAPHQGASAY